MTLKEIRASLTKMLFKLEEVNAEDGTVLIYDGDVIAEGMEVKTYDEKGELIKANGKFVVKEDTIEIKDGIVVSIERKQEEVKEDAIEEKQEEIKLEEVTEVKEEIIEDKTETVSKEEFDKLLKLVESLAAEIETIKSEQNKTKETVIKMSEQEMGEVINNKPIEINRSDSNSNPALKYFNK